MEKLVAAGTLCRHALPLIALVLLTSANVCLAQFTDDFSDGDLIANPAWLSTDLNQWLVENNSLRSNSSMASSTFAISTPSTTAMDAQWDFWMNLKFNTSSANYVDVFLIADNQVLNAGTSGYFVRIGGTADEVSLFKIIGGIATKIIDGSDGKTNSSNNLLRVKVIRSQMGDWTLSVDYSGGTAFTVEGTVLDTDIQTSQFFGIQITQSTSTFFNKHYFDDIYAGPIIKDTTPPEVETISIVGSNEIKIVFSEPIDMITAENVSNYTIDPIIGQPLQAVLQSDGQTVILSLSQSLQNLMQYTVSVSGVTDLSDNVMNTFESQLFFYDVRPAEHKDIVITEIFADPTPVVGLPEAEFVELLNRSEFAYDLKDWKITDGSSVATLPSYLLLPRDYLIISSASLVDLFNAYPNRLGATSFPTLNNTGDDLQVISPENLIIDEVRYEDTWYKDGQKSQGGFTLELIDTENVCSQADNWTVSEADIGGTPGETNSVDANNPDLTGPTLISAFPVSSTNILLTFNEDLEKSSPQLASFHIDGVNILEVRFEGNGFSQLMLTIESPLMENTWYTIDVTAVYDCAGNELLEEFRHVEFGLPVEAAPGDVVINEILFNPKPFGVDFVELYNVSEKFLTIKDWQIGNYQDGGLNSPKVILDHDRMLFPHQHLALTTDPAQIIGAYPSNDPKNILKVKSLPSLNDGEGTVAISDGGELIDYFLYAEDMHSPLLRDKEGVSLERISAGTGTNEPSNWQSASSVAGYGTPGLVNSSSRPEILQEDVISVMPEIFEPEKGQPFFTQIAYRLKNPGFAANIKILDHSGRIIKDIANNVLLGTTGFFTWDGDTNEGTRARIGYYVVWAELFDLNGNVVTYRKRVMIASRL